MLEAAFRTKNLDKVATDQVVGQQEGDGEALYHRLCRLLQRHPDLTELGFVPYADPAAYGDATASGEDDGEAAGMMDDGENGRPFFVCERSLGMAFWALPPIYQYAWTRLIPLLRTPTSERSPEWSKLADQLSTVVLLINADNYSAWNGRKRLITTGHSSIDHEFWLINLIMSKHPKSGESWAHRRWLLHLAGQTSLPLSQEMLKGELDACLKVAQRYPKNYHAWTHRLLLTHVMDLAQVTKELRDLETWGRRYVGDHSGWHHRQGLLLRALHLSGYIDDASALYRPDPYLYVKPLSEQPRPELEQEVIMLWQREFWLCRKLILIFPGHEALWSHRRFLMDHWAKVLLPRSSQLHHTFFFTGSTQPDYEEEEIGFKDDERGEEEPVNLVQESKFVERCCTDDTQERFQAQRQAGRAYFAWVTHFVLAPQPPTQPPLDRTTGPRSLWAL